MYIIIGAIVGIALCGIFFHSQNHAIDQICNHPELSDDKVKSIAKISTEQFKFFKIFKK